MLPEIFRSKLMLAMNAITMVLRTTTTKSVVTSAEAFLRKRFFMEILDRRTGFAG